MTFTCVSKINGLTVAWRTDGTAWQHNKFRDDGSGKLIAPRQAWERIPMYDCPQNREPFVSDMEKAETAAGP